MYANMLNRLKNYFGIENIFVESSIHKMELLKDTISIHNDTHIMQITLNAIALTLTIFIEIAL